jgi:prolyl-tRNA editing enzyme YbaK/EbsC (Cys-tRNA(Pro) deacylase)
VAKGLTRFLQATEGLGLVITEHPHSTHTAQEAADAVGAEVGAIVKSLLFIKSGAPLLVLASGANTVDVGVVERHLGATLEKADAASVKLHTGFSIGGVPPFGHPTRVETVMDQDLMAFGEVWAAAGSANAVFPIAPTELQELAAAQVLAVK